MDHSSRTAISRRSLSAPSRYLYEAGLLRGRVLDFGCGRGDIVRFVPGIAAEQFDPTWYPERPEGKFDTIVMNYVVCVLPPLRRSEALADAVSYLGPDGVLYIGVRRDVRMLGATSRGTEQFDVHMDLPVEVNRSGRFCIYRFNASAVDG